MSKREPPLGKQPTDEQVKAILNFIMHTNRQALVNMARHDTDPARLAATPTGARSTEPPTS